jgi:hypothetical protein
MTDKIIEFPGETILASRPGRVLQAAIDADLAIALVIGMPKDGDGNPDFDEELYFSGSTSDLAMINMLVDRAKKILLSHM